MKALLVSEIFPPQTGGSGRWLFELYRRLPAGSVVVASGEYTGDDDFDRGQLLPIERLPLAFPSWGVFSPARFKTYLKAYKRLRNLIRRQTPESIHCGKLLPEGWLAWLLRLRTGLPYWIYVHGEELQYGAQSRELGWMMRRILAAASGVIANSENTAALLGGQWRVPADRLHMLNPGVDAQRFCPAPRDAAVRRRLGWGERPVVLTVGRLQKRKGQDMLIRAIAAIRQRVPNVLYSIVGDGQERAALERLIAEQGLADHVELRGEPSDAALIECYQQCDLFVLPNRTVGGDFEGFGMVLVEAQACGQPVIAGDSGGTRETMRVGQTGMIVDCTQPEPLAEAVFELLADGRRREQMGQAARQFVLSRFDWPQLVAKAAKILGLAGELAEIVQTDRMECRASDGVDRPLKIFWPPNAGSVEESMPISLGIDLPVAKLRDAGDVRLELPGGANLAAQATPLGRWHDGSVRWLLIDCVAPSGTPLAGSWRVRVNDAAEPIAAGLDAVVTAQEEHESIQLIQSGMTLSFDKLTGDWSAVALGKLVARARLPEVIDAKGRKHFSTVTEVRLKASGPVRATVEIEAEYRTLRGLRMVARWSAFAGSNSLAGEITLHNPRRARHRGGLWDLGDPGSILLADFTQSVSLVEAEKSGIRYRCEPGQDVQFAGGRCEVYQESSGGENWNSQIHVNRHGAVPLALRGYRASGAGEALARLRAQPVVEIAGESVALAAEIEHFWQQFPKALEADSGEVHLRLFPGQFPDLHELQGGEQKTHRIWLTLHATENLEERPLRSLRLVQPRSLSPQAIPGLPDWTNADPAILARLDELAEEFLTGPRGLYANRERVDEYGWRNWGELHADHEELHYRGPEPLISHYNNQFDVLSGFLLQYLRTGDERWMDLAHPLARHVTDIDIYHTTEDRPAYSGGLFWFTDHYRPAATSSHRTYSRHNAPEHRDYGGGPSACHNFTTGLFLYHLLTGDVQARDAVITLADWVLAQDDGSRTVLGLVDDGPTGMASASSDALDHRPGRAAGNSINALLDAWLLTNNARYLAHAESLIERCVHPTQDIDALDLLHAEKHWSYTVFLVSLDKYLKCKEGHSQIDDAYRYGRDSLLHYGRWMLEQERPYLDRPRELEFPTEAWAAQEFRKASALGLAAGYAAPALAAQLLERGQALAERAWSDLLAFPTRTTARAMAIVLVEGLRDAELRRRIAAGAPGAAAASVTTDVAVYPPHRDFLPQRERVKRRLRSPAGVATLLARAASPARWPRIMNHV